MPETQAKENVSRIIPMTADDLIFLQLKDLKDEFRDSRKELNARMDRIEQCQDKLEAKLETTRQELNERIDKVDAKIDTTRQELSEHIDKVDAKIDTVRKELNARMDKQDAKIDKLANKIDELSKKIDASINQGQICLITTIGIAITVLYSIFSK